MFAIIETGGKQYKVKTGDTVCLELLDIAPKAKTVKLEKVLLASEEGKVSVGRPYLTGAYCEADVLGEIRAPKVISFKYIRREKSATKIGHRQNYHKVKISKIHFTS